MATLPLTEKAAIDQTKANLPTFPTPANFLQLPSRTGDRGQEEEKNSQFGTFHTRGHIHQSPVSFG